MDRLRSLPASSHCGGFIGRLSLFLSCLARAVVDGVEAGAAQTTPR